MRKILLTWYGITDLRASLGMEYSVGPVLGALMAEDYTDVVILGFTSMDNTKSGELREMGTVQERLAKIEKSDPAAERQFLFNMISNTEEAHKHFIQWLKNQLHNATNEVLVRFHPVNLKHLNDTEGIYEVATRSLDAVAMEEGEKMVTLYLSPGTPVMAFVWAFAALRHPNLKKRLIASSQVGKPPENILLPNEWLEWHGRQVRTTGTDLGQFDVIIHLFGDQRVPSLLGTIQFACDKHIFVASEEYPADVMKQFVGEDKYHAITIDPYDPENVRTTILDLIAGMSSNIRIGFNLTGGTKLMYAGALAACRKVNSTPFYFSSRNNKVIFLNDFRSTDTKLIPSVETFIKLNGNNLFISKSGHWDEIPSINFVDRQNLTSELWQRRSKISKIYKELSNYNNGFKPFEIDRGDIYVKLSKDKSAKISIGTKHFEFKEWVDVAKYLSGGWFEEYTYLKLLPFLKSGLIKDLRIGLKVSFKEDSTDNRPSGFSERLSSPSGETYQELDIVFTNGKRLYVIECKAGNVNSEHVMKLQNIIRYFGGIEGRAVLASCFGSTNKIVRKKIKDSKNIEMASGNDFLKQLEKIIQSGGNP